MRILFVALCVLMVGGLFAQAPDSTLRRYARQYPQEKVVLQLAKQEYLAGENIDFKAYVLTGYEASLISTNLYAELYDREKKLLQQQLIPLQKGTGNGRFVLPVSLAEDVYYIRAYTQWMRNFDPRFFFVQPVPIYNPYSSQSLQQKPVQWKAKSFLENEILLQDAPANVVVRLFTGGTLPKSWTGELMESGSATPVASLSVYNNEIGQVRFLPQAGRQYKIVVQDNHGAVEELPLPPVQKSGVVLQATPIGSRLRYSLLFRDIPSGGKGYKLVASFQNEPVVVASIVGSTGEVSGTFDIGQLPAGVLQLTLFDEKEKPVTERLCFLHQDSLQTLTPALFTDTLSLTPKGRNHWQLAVDTSAVETYNVMVGDAAWWQPGSFLSAVYLTSDFPTPVYQPEWYFTDVTPQKMSALAALLVTEKWTRYRWNDLLQHRFPVVHYRPDALLNFTGQVSKGKKPQPFRDINLLLQAVDSSISFVQVKTDSAGRFVLNQLYFTDSLKVYYQPNKRKLFESELEISFVAENRFAPWEGALPFSPLAIKSRSAADTLPRAVQKAMAQRSAELLLAEKTKMLEAVVVTTKARSATEELERQLTSGAFAGGNADIFDFVNQQQTVAGYLNILQWLQGRVPSFTILYQNGMQVPRIRNSPVQIFLDEVPVQPDMIESLNPNDIALLKVYRNNFVGSFGGGSAIAIYTRRGGMNPQDLVPLLPSNVLQGYAAYLPQAGPDYSQEEAREVRDERVVLFNNSLLLPGKKAGHISIIFYNNDTAKKFRIIVTGFSNEGRLVYLDRPIP